MRVNNKWGSWRTKELKCNSHNTYVRAKTENEKFVKKKVKELIHGDRLTTVRRKEIFRVISPNNKFSAVERRERNSN